MPEWDDFDGAAVAQARNYLQQDVEVALQEFADARFQSVARLRGASQDDWKKRGLHRGVGAVTLTAVVEMMAEHDRAHTQEIVSLLEELEG